jgi:hypothetical protein
MSPTVKPMKRYHCASQNTPSFASRIFVADQSGDFTYPQLFGFCFLLVSKEIENNKLFFFLTGSLDPRNGFIFFDHNFQEFFFSKQC